MAPPIKYPNPANGTTFGSWTIIDGVSKYRNKARYVMCRCVCGLECSISLHSLHCGDSTMCKPCGNGIHNDIIENAVIRRSLNKRISQIIDRCCNPFAFAYKDYGGRGITVYPEWLADRREFLRYLTTLPGWDNIRLQIDRENNDGNYEPGNLRFVTPRVNTNNRRERKR